MFHLSTTNMSCNLVFINEIVISKCHIVLCWYNDTNVMIQYVTCHSIPASCHCSCYLNTI